MKQDAVSDKVEKAAEEKMKLIARSLAKKVDDIYEQYKSKYEVIDGKIAMTVKNISVNMFMQEAIERVLQTHMDLMQEVMDKSVFKQALNAVVASYKAAGNKVNPRKA